MNKGYKQNEISQSYLKNKKSDLAIREKKILNEISSKLGFIPQKSGSRSRWWTSKAIGAFTYQGIYEGKKAIIKIQGVKPITSEINLIKSFEKNNQSKIIRPPYLYAYSKWDEKLNYEALVLEDVGHKKVINSPTQKDEIAEFFKIYYEYKNNCLVNPWTLKPKESLSEMTKNSFDSWKKITLDLFPNHPLRQAMDLELINKSIKLLVFNYQNIEPEFMHGHFSANDLIKVGNEITLRSNLYWSWRNPFRDAVFAYHWFFYYLSSVENITEKQVEEQKSMWLNIFYEIPKNKNEVKLIKLALLERATAGLNLDALSIDPKKKISAYLVSQTRKDVIKLYDELS